MKELIYIGVLLSTLGAGLQSLAGAPRLLEKVGRDRLIPQLSFLSQPGKVDTTFDIEMLSFAMSHFHNLRV